MIIKRSIDKEEVKEMPKAVFPGEIHIVRTVTGLICGLLVDIFFGDVIGLYALIYMYIGFFSGLFKKMFHTGH